MSLPLYFDVNTPGPLFDGVTRIGLKAIRAQDDGRDQASDDEILDRAAELGCIVVTTDLDLLQIAARRQTTGIGFAGVVFVRQSGIDYGQCIDDLQLTCDVYQAAEMLNCVAYVPLHRH